MAHPDLPGSLILTERHGAVTRLVLNAPGSLNALSDAMLAALTEALDGQGDTAAAAQQVRALMFVARFRDDMARRLSALDR